MFSAILDVDAQRLQIRVLFSKSAAVRDELLRSEMEDDKLEKLNDARKKLGVISKLAHIIPTTISQTQNLLIRILTYCKLAKNFLYRKHLILLSYNFNIKYHEK